jgi:hypothetical protein
MDNLFNGDALIRDLKFRLAFVFHFSLCQHYANLECKFCFVVQLGFPPILSHEAENFALAFPSIFWGACYIFLKSSV